jgi:ketosteroid isomerase-like protein
MDTADRIALHELAATYGDVIDARDWPGLTRVFTEDAVYSSPAMPGRDINGVAMITKFMSKARHPLSHHITNIRVEDAADGPIVHSRVILVHDDGTTSSGEYHDHVVQTDQGWRVAARSFTARVRPASDPPPPS